MNFSIIYNPIATEFTQKALDHLIYKMKERGLTLNKVAKSEYSGHVIELIKTLDPVSDYLFTIGGDGTVNEAVVAFNAIEQHSVYGHISAGTTNDMANNYNLDRHDAIKSIDKLAEQGVETQQDSILVNGEPVCYVSSFGYVAPVPYLVNVDLKKKMGHAAYVVSALPILMKKPEWIRLKYTANGATKEVTTCLALITTSKGMGGITLYPHADNNDGKFEVFFLEKLSPVMIAQIMPHYLSDTIDLNDYKKYCTCFSTDHMIIEFPGLPPTYDLDNDGNRSAYHFSLHERRLEFKMGKKIKVLMPLR